MGTRATAVKKVYSRISNSELKPVAEFYKGKLTAAGVLALFTAKDGDVDAGWVTDFENAITAVGNVVPSRTIIQTNKDITQSIKLNSKQSVMYGKVLAYYLKKAFSGQPGLIDSFPIVAANEKMRSGDTEGFLFEVNTIIQQLTVATNQAVLLAKNWPASNLTDYETLASSVSALNTQQELAKQLVPENTDAATTIRNECYGFIDTLVELKDIVYAADKQKRHDWALSTILNQIRGGSGGTKKVVREGDVNPGVTASFDTAVIQVNENTVVKVEVNNGARISSNMSEAAPGGPIFWDVVAGMYEKSVDEFMALTGASEVNHYIKIQNPGPWFLHFKITFDDVE